MKIHFHIIKLNYKLIAIFLILILFFSCIFVYSYVKANEEPYIEVPIIMYHSVLKSRSGSYIVHPDTLEKDLAYIKEKGYTSITMTDLINYVYCDTSLPEKPIIITFDDGHYNNLGYAVPLLKKYDMKAVISIVGKYTDDFSRTDEANLNYGHLRWKDINELIQDGTIEFQNHTYNLHTIGARRGSMKKKR
ncbi:MAG: polysaccharide deacetylase family protein [Clostridia bacterium]|nr:polysaccharide deacetylase family protein [Clostridia bacterium]